MRGSEYNIPSRAVQLFLDKIDLYVFTTEVHILDPATGQVKQALQKNLSPSHLVNGKFYGPDWVRDANSLRLVTQLESPSIMPREGSSRCKKYVPPFTFSGGQIYAGGQCGGVYALDNRTHQIQWEYRPESLTQNPNAIYQGRLYVLFEDGEIHAIDPEVGENRGALKTNLGLPGYVRDADFSSRGLVANDDILVATFNDRFVWAFCKKPCF